MSFGPIAYGATLALMIVMLAGTMLIDRQHELVVRARHWLHALIPGDRGPLLARSGARLLLTTSLAGLTLFILPPMGEMPPDWQIALAFLVWIAWCYRYGLVSRRRVGLAAVEALPSLWLSLGWAQLLVLARII